MPDFLGLDVNDAALALAIAGDNGTRSLPIDTGRPESPGFADADGAAGWAARAHARRQPHCVSDSYWERLTDEPATAAGTALGATWRELAIRQLRASGAAGANGDPVLLAVPDSWVQAGHTAAVVGCARSAEIAVCGMVAAPLAAAAAGLRHGLAGDSAFLYLELTRAQGEVSLLARTGDHVCVSGQPWVVPGCGLRAVEDALMDGLDARLATDAGISPSETPELEQALFDALPGLLDTLARGAAASLELERTPLRLERAEAAAMLDKLTGALAEHVREAISARELKGAVLIKLGPCAARVPGLREQLESIRGVVAEPLPAGHVAVGAASLARNLNLRPQDPAHPGKVITEAPVSALSGYEELAPLANAARAHADTSGARDRLFTTGPGGFITPAAPSHVLFQGRAVPLEGNTFAIGREPGDGACGIAIEEDFPGLAPVHARLTRHEGTWHAAEGTQGAEVLINQRGLSGEARPVSVGDVLTLGDTGLKAMLIRVVE